MKTKILLISLLCIGLLSCEKEDKNVRKGALPGVFSVSDTKKVRFSQGNLQYQASTDTWRFAEHQYDMVGMGYGWTNYSNNCYVAGNVQNSDNREISSTYDGWIDLFGWGTGNNPTNVSEDYYDYSTFVDWGVNKISNGGNVANAWFTLSGKEWYYLLYERALIKRGVAEVNGIPGLVLLPDNWTLPSGAHFTPGDATNYGRGYEYYKTVNTYTASEWTLMEKAGAVFLPAAGHRYGTSVHGVGSYGNYWSCAEFDTDDAFYLYFYSDEVGTGGSYRLGGRSVRLCSEVK